MALGDRMHGTKPNTVLAPTADFRTAQQLSHDLQVSRERQPPAPPTTSHVLTTALQNGLSIRAMLRQEEDRHRCRPLQGTLRRRRESARSRIRDNLLTNNTQAGKGLIKVNGKPLSLVQPEILRFKVYEPVLILGLDKFGTPLSARIPTRRNTSTKTRKN